MELYMKKKTLLTIGIATFLALIVAFLIFHLSCKPELIKDDVQKETIENIEVNNAKTKALEPQEEIRIESKYSTIKRPVANKTTFKEHSKNLIKEDNIKKQDIQEAHVENDIEPTESGVEVPVNFVSKNTYKYVYTPAKYPKKKY